MSQLTSRGLDNTSSAFVSDYIHRQIIDVVKVSNIFIKFNQGQKDFAVILAKNRGTATSQTRLIRG